MKEILENISLKQYNTFGIEATARYFTEPENIIQIRELLRSKYKLITPMIILGEGSNMLFTSDFEGMVIRPLIKGIELLEETDKHVYLKVGAGENWDEFVTYCVGNNYGGIENLSSIPGSVGASPVQNIGAYGVEIKDVIEYVETIDSESTDTVVFHVGECSFDYRSSIFKNTLYKKYIITNVVFRLDKIHRYITHYGAIEKELDKYSETNICNIREVVINIRRSKLPDPKEIGNAGSFFKNPVVSRETLEYIKKFYTKVPYWEYKNDLVKLSAAWLIETSQWKSKKIGQAGTFRKQPLVIVNYGNATSKDILTLARKIQRAVKTHFAIQLEPEVNII